MIRCVRWADCSPLCDSQSSYRPVYIERRFLSMQSLNTKYYVYPTLAGLFGIGCALLIFLIRRRRDSIGSQDEPNSIQHVEILNEINAENDAAATAKEADPLKKMESVKSVTVGSTTLQGGMQRNILLAISSFLLIASL